MKKQATDYRKTGKPRKETIQAHNTSARPAMINEP